MISLSEFIGVSIVVMSSQNQMKLHGEKNYQYLDPIGIWPI